MRDFHSRDEVKAEIESRLAAFPKALSYAIELLDDLPPEHIYWTNRAVPQWLSQTRPDDEVVAFTQRLIADKKVAGLKADSVEQLVNLLATGEHWMLASQFYELWSQPGIPNEAVRVALLHVAADDREGFESDPQKLAKIYEYRMGQHTHVLRNVLCLLRETPEPIASTLFSKAENTLQKEEEPATRAVALTTKALAEHRLGKHKEAYATASELRALLREPKLELQSWHLDLFDGFISVYVAEICHDLGKTDEAAKEIDAANGCLDRLRASPEATGPWPDFPSWYPKAALVILTREIEAVAGRLKEIPRSAEK